MSDHQQTTSAPVRFGLVGTGYWARELHAAGLQGHRDAVLTAVWGRDPDKARALASDHGARAHEDLDELIDAVDAVVFAVPPDVQAPVARRAAQAGRHLLLEKPVALTVQAAEELEQAVQSAGVSSVVFFTERFDPGREAWLQERATSGCLGGSAAWMASLRSPGNPFAHSPWRQQEGALWDVGPHALSVLLPVLGPVVDVAGARGTDDLVHLVLRHQAGRTSTLSLSLTMPPAATRFALGFYDNEGWYERPQPSPGDALARQRQAVSELVADIRAGRTEHRVDVCFGTEVVRILERAQSVLGPTGRA